MSWPRVASPRSDIVTSSVTNSYQIRLIAYGKREVWRGGHPSEKTLFITLYPNLVSIDIWLWLCSWQHCLEHGDQRSPITKVTGFTACHMLKSTPPLALTIA